MKVKELKMLLDGVEDDADMVLQFTHVRDGALVAECYQFRSAVKSPDRLVLISREEEQWP